MMVCTPHPPLPSCFGFPGAPCCRQVLYLAAEMENVRSIAKKDAQSARLYAVQKFAKQVRCMHACAVNRAESSDRVGALYAVPKFSKPVYAHACIWAGRMPQGEKAFCIGVNGTSAVSGDLKRRQKHTTIKKRDLLSQ